MIVLDSSAVLAALFGETGADRVERVLHRSVLSVVNLVEVLTRLKRSGGDVVQGRDRLDGLGVSVVPLSDAAAVLAAELWPQTQSLGLSLGDRICLASAITLGLPVMTSDRLWAQLSLPVQVELIR